MFTVEYGIIENKGLKQCSKDFESFTKAEDFYLEKFVIFYLVKNTNITKPKLYEIKKGNKKNLF